MSTTHPMIMEADSHLIAIDNHSSCCMANNIHNFIHPITLKKVKIKGFQEASSLPYGIFTIKWKIDDDQGKTHDIVIKNVLYVPEAKQRLFYSQQWAKQQNDNYHKIRCTYIIQDKDVLELLWNQDIFMKIISKDKYTNTAFMQTSPTFDRAIKFIKQFLSDTDQSQIERAYTCKSTNRSHLDKIREMNLFIQNQKTQDKSILHKEETGLIHSTSMQGELLRWHYRLGHISFNKLKMLSVLGIKTKKAYKS